MRTKSQIKKSLYDKDVYLSEFKTRTQKNWAVIIMPDNIIIDDYHKKEVHIHYDSHRHYLSEKITMTDRCEVFEKVMNHIEDNKGLDIDKLITELKK